MDMYMTMYFYQSVNVHFLIANWSVQDATHYWFALGGCVLIGFFVEALSVFVNKLEGNAKTQMKLHGSMQTKIRLWQMIANMVRLFLSYILMLAVMTFNVGILLASVLGLTLGYLFLGFAEISIDITNDGRISSSEHGYEATPNQLIY